MAKKQREADKKPNPPGRPQLYKANYHPRQVFKLCLLGATNERIADFFEVERSTITEWMNKYPAFSTAIKAGREEADAKVADALYNRALGYSHKAHKLQLDRSGKWQVKEYTERYPPDPTSALFWLKNRKPDQWREKLDIETKTITVKVQGENNTEGTE